MFQIQLENCGKRFNRNWIFRKLSHNFSSGNSYAILGPNGSGKSTLLQCMAGYQTISEGNILFSHNGNRIAEEVKYRHLVLASPFLELVEEFTLTEILHFHFRMKKMAFISKPEDILEITGLSASAHKQLKFFSSGMKQRVKLALAFFSDTDILMLDEPCTNFDTKGIDWYHQLVEKYTKERLVLVASNQQNEYSFCKEVIELV